MRDTPVENIFINEMMTDAPGEYVKTYLFALMYADLGMVMDNHDIARHLGMEVEDVLKCWTYWEGRRVIKKRYENPSNRLSYEVEFLDLKSRIYGKSPAKKKGDDMPSEIKELLENEEIRELCREVESILGGPLPHEAIMKTVSWVADWGAAPEVVAFAYRHALRRKEMGKSAPPGNMTAYVAKVVRSWVDNGLETVDDVTRYLEETDNHYFRYRKVLRSLGMHRSSTEAEQRIIDRWFNELDLDMETVMAACDKTAGTNSPNMHYVNTVLENWSKGDKTARVGGGKGKSPAGKKMITATVRHLEKLKEKAEEEAERRRAEVYAKLPIIKDLDEGIRRSSVEISKVMLSGALNAKETVARLRKEIEAAKQERAFLMTDNDYRVDYMDVRYHCALCKDTGVSADGGRCSCFTEYMKGL